MAGRVAATVYSNSGQCIQLQAKMDLSQQKKQCNDHFKVGMCNSAQVKLLAMQPMLASKTPMTLLLLLGRL